jgi:hypothetical protein
MLKCRCGDQGVDQEVTVREEPEGFRGFWNDQRGGGGTRMGVGGATEMRGGCRYDRALKFKKRNGKTVFIL